MEDRKLRVKNAVEKLARSTTWWSSDAQRNGDTFYDDPGDVNVALGRGQDELKGIRARMQGKCHGELDYAAVTQHNRGARPYTYANPRRRGGNEPRRARSNLRERGRPPLKPAEGEG